VPVAQKPALARGGIYPDSLVSRNLSYGIVSSTHNPNVNIELCPEGTGWLIAGQPLDANRRYSVAVSDFLVSGKEIGPDFMTLKQAGVQLFEDGRDIRFALIEQLKAPKGQKPGFSKKPGFYAFTTPISCLAFNLLIYCKETEPASLVLPACRGGRHTQTAPRTSR